MPINAYGGYGPGLLGVCWTFFIITATLLALRVYVRLRITAEGGWALFWTFVGFMTVTAELLVLTVDVSHGFGNHIALVEEAGQTSSLILDTWIAYFLFNINVPLGKFCAVSLLLVLHARTHPKRRYLIHFIAISNLVFAIPSCIMMWFQCKPIDALWDPARQDQCNSWPSLNYIRFLLAWSALSDFILALLPALLIWPLQMSRKLKLGISFLMGLGVFAGISALMMIYYAKDFGSPDLSYDLSTVFYLGKITTWLVLIAASVPPTWPLFRRILQSSKTSAPPPKPKPRQEAFIPLRERNEPEEGTSMGGMSQRGRVDSLLMRSESVR